MDIALLHISSLKILQYVRSSVAFEIFEVTCAQHSR